MRTNDDQIQTTSEPEDLELPSDIQYLVSLSERSHEQLCKDFLIEKKAKNRAFHFILKQGQLEKFMEFCREEK